MVNPSKTTATIFIRKYKPEVIKPLKLRGKELAYANSIKYLGITLDIKLSWTSKKRETNFTSLWRLVEELWERFRG